MPAILFDLDGTLIDVSESYDFAVTRAVQMFCEKIAGLRVEGDLVKPSDLAALRSAGGFNNDWDLAAGLTIWALDQHGGIAPGSPLTDAAYDALPAVVENMRRAGGGLAGLAQVVAETSVARVAHNGSSIHTSTVVRIFQEVYLGERFRTVYDLPNEFWDGPAAYRREKPLIDGALLEILARLGSPGIVTGRPRLEADLAVTMLNPWLSPRVVISDDDLVDASGRHRPDWRKPAGEPLRMALDQLGGSSAEPAVYLGDLPDDVLAVQDARGLTGRQIYSIGCAYGAEDSGSRARVLRAAGADVVAEDPGELPALIENLLISGSDR